MIPVDFTPLSDGGGIGVVPPGFTDAASKTGEGELT